MYCALLLPDFRLQAALRHHPERWQDAIALLLGDTVAEATAAALLTGVRPGQTPAQAMARCSSLQLLRSAPEQEASLAQLLLEQATQLSAHVEATAPALCTLDLHAVPRLSFQLQALQEWGGTTLQRLKTCLLQARGGIAPTPDQALLAARATSWGTPLQVILHTSDFLDPLPLHALDPSPEAAAILQQWGITTLGQLRRLKRQALTSRLREEGALLHDRATGQSRRLLKLVRPVEQYEEAHDFDHELESTEPLLFLLKRFIDQLILRVGMIGKVIAKMELTLTLSNRTSYHHTFCIPSPTLGCDVLFRMLETHLESLRLAHPLTGVRLRAEPIHPGGHQFRLFESALRDPNRFAETLARITALTGHERIGIPEPLPGHKPDRFTLRSPDFIVPPAILDRPPLPSLIGLPLRRFRPPLPARVRLCPPPSRTPIHLEAKTLHGQIIGLHGPYRLSGDWWEGGWNREEWDVALHTGRLCRLTRQRSGEPEWFVEGVYA